MWSTLASSSTWPDTQPHTAHSYFPPKSLPCALRQATVVWERSSCGLCVLCQGWVLTGGSPQRTSWTKGICGTRGIWEVTVLKEQTPASTLKSKQAEGCFLCFHICFFFSLKDSTSQSYWVSTITLPRRQVPKSRSPLHWQGKHKCLIAFKSAWGYCALVSSRRRINSADPQGGFGKSEWRAWTSAGIPSCFTAYDFLYSLAHTCISNTTCKNKRRGAWRIRKPRDWLAWGSRLHLLIWNFPQT